MIIGIQLQLSRRCTRVDEITFNVGSLKGCDGNDDSRK